MNRPDNITSTEKLLDVIRKKRGDIPPNLQQGKIPRVNKGRVFRLNVPSIVNLQKVPSVGIDIGHEYLRLVRASRLPGGHWQVEDLRKWDIPEHLLRESPEFGEFLKTALDKVIGSSKQIRLWIIMSTAHVEVHSIRIPKLPKNQVANAVYWTLKKSAPFDEQEMIFDFEIRGEVIEQGVPKLAVMAYVAPRREIKDIESLFARIGRPLTGISIVPFALQNIFRTGWIEAEEKIITSMYVGNDFSRIDIYASNNLVMTRGIKAGNNSMIEALNEAYNKSRPNAPPLKTLAQSRKILFSVCRDSSPLLETDAGFGIEEKEIFEMIQPALERIVRQVEMTFKYFSEEQQQENITKIFISGALSVYQPILDYIGAKLEISCNILNPLSDKDAIAICEDLDDSHCLSERISFTPALGVALSDNDYTPNFMFTFKDKERKTSVRRINRIVFSAFIAAVLVFGAIFSYQSYNISHKRSVISGMERTLAGIGQDVDRDQLLKMADRISQQQKLSKVYADRYLGMALINELAALTPANIRLFNLKMNLGQTPSVETVKTAKEETKGPLVETVKTAKEETKGPTKEVSVDGLVFGERQIFETTLVGYVMALEASPLFSQVAIQKSNVEPYAKDGALHFILNLKVEDRVHG